MAGRRRVTSSRAQEVIVEDVAASGEPAPERGPVYTVEAIVDYRELRGKDHWLVHWEGYSSDDRTWEPRAHLSAISEDFKVIMDKLKREAKAKKKAGARPRRGKSVEEKSSDVASKDLTTEAPARRTRSRVAAKTASETFQAVSEAAEVLCERHQSIVGLPDAEAPSTSDAAASPEEKQSAIVEPEPLLTFDDLLPPQAAASSEAEVEQDDILFRALGVNSKDLAPSKEKTGKEDAAFQSEADESMEGDGEPETKNTEGNTTTDQVELLLTAPQVSPEVDDIMEATLVLETMDETEIHADPHEITTHANADETEGHEDGHETEGHAETQSQVERPGSGTDAEASIPVIVHDEFRCDMSDERVVSTPLETIPEEEDEPAVESSPISEVPTSSSAETTVTPHRSGEALLEKSDCSSGTDTKDWVVANEGSPVFVDLSSSVEASRNLTEIISDDEDEPKKVFADIEQVKEKTSNKRRMRSRLPDDRLSPSSPTRTRKRPRLSEASTSAPSSGIPGPSDMTKMIGKAATHVMAQPDISYAVIESQGMRNPIYPPYVYAARPNYPMLSGTYAQGTGPVIAECHCAATRGLVASASLSEDPARVLHLGAQPPKGVFGPWGLVQTSNGDQSYLPIEQIKSRYPQALINYLLPRVRFGQSH